MKPNSTLYYKDGTRYELWIYPDGGMSKTVYVDQTGWQTTYWWSSPRMAQGEFNDVVARAHEDGTWSSLRRPTAAADMPQPGTLAFTAMLLADSGIMTGEEADRWKDEMKDREPTIEEDGDRE